MIEKYVTYRWYADFVVPAVILGVVVVVILLLVFTWKVQDKWKEFMDRKNRFEDDQDKDCNKIECQCVDCQYYSDNYCTYEGEE